MSRLLTGFVLACCALLVACTTVTTVNGVEVSDAGKAEAEPRKRAQIRTELAATYFQTRQLSVALEEVQRALQIEPNYAPAHAVRGLIYMDLGDVREAEASLTRALQLEPDNGNILNNYGWFLCQNGRERESIAYFERAASNRLYATPGMALRNAGICLLRSGNSERAEEMLRRSFERDASDPVTKFQLAQLYLKQNRIERARFYYRLLDKVPQKSAEVIWLGVRIARANGDLRTERELGTELQQRFPESKEYSALRRGAYDE
jgi:type IV pilus assembly protein PilF